MTTERNTESTTPVNTVKYPHPWLVKLLEWQPMSEWHLQQRWWQDDYNRMQPIALELAEKLGIDPKLVSAPFDKEGSLSRQKAEIEAHGFKYLLRHCDIHGWSLSMATKTTCIQCKRDLKFSSMAEREEWDGGFIRIYRYTDEDLGTLYVGQTSQVLMERKSLQARQAFNTKDTNPFGQYIRNTYADKEDFKENCNHEELACWYVDKDEDPLPYRVFARLVEAQYIKDLEPLYNGYAPDPDEILRKAGYTAESLVEALSNPEAIALFKELGQGDE